MAGSMSSIEDMTVTKEAGATVTRGQSRRQCGRFPQRTVIIVGVAAALLILGLAIGLGVGLTVGRGNGNNGSEPVSTSPPAPVPTGNTTGNGTYWQPAVKSTWQIVLQDPIMISSDNTTTNPDVDIFDIDLFSNPNTTISALQKLGKRVICYFSAGSYEPYRPDSSQFLPADIGNGLDGWPEEKWIDIRSPNIRTIMANRIALASEKGCDAVDPDNVDGYNNNNGLGLTEADTISFMQFLSSEAVTRGLSIGLKNAGEVLTNLTSVVHFSVNEQCVQYSECATFAGMVQAGKPVFHIEYPNGSPGNVAVKTAINMCSTTGGGQGSDNFSTVLKGMDLDGWVEYCNHVIANTTMLAT